MYASNDASTLPRPILMIFVNRTSTCVKRFSNTVWGLMSGTVTLPDGLKLDFSTARTETYAGPGALPEVEPSSIVDDLRRRDFPFNAMAVALRPERFGELIDPFGGRVDLDRRRVRVLHNLSFIEDPTRLFRAVQIQLSPRFGQYWRRTSTWRC